MKLPAAALIAFLPVAASASPFVLGPVGTAGDITADVTTPSGTENVYIGQYQMTVTDQATSLSVVDAVWCTDPDTLFASGDLYTLSSTSLVARLGAMKAEQITALAEADLPDQPAVAASIWAVVEGSYSVTVGSLVVTGAPDQFYTDAAAYLAAVAGGSLQPVAGERVLEFVPVDGPNQTFALVSTAIPEPWSIAILGIGLLGIAGVRRRV